MIPKKAKQSSFLKKLDLYGSLFNFTINREEKFKTNMGAFLSILTYLLIITTSIFFGKDFYNRTNPKILSQTTIPEKHSNIDISNKLLTISWRVEDANGNEIDFTGKFYAKLVYSPYIMNPSTKNLDNIENRNLPMKRCNETTNEENFNMFINPESWYCVNFDIKDLQFGGYWDSEFLYSFNLNLNMCKYDLNNKKTDECVKFQDFKEFLDQRVFFVVNFPSVYFD